MLRSFLIVAFTANLILLTESSDKHHHRCRANERYVQCPDTVCLPKTCDELGYPVPCIDLGPDGKCPSKPACICEEGYVRNNLGICIPVEYCPSCGGDENAISGCGVNCGKHCSDYFGHRRPCPKICYPNACDCRDGYYYDDYTKKCVLSQKCTICNKPNQEYSHCIYDCPPQTCESLDRAYICLPNDTPCRAGCRCKFGYYRNLINECISEAECRKCPGPHEYYSCGGACDNVCATLQEQNQTNCPIINIKCNEMCYCEEGYARDSNNICIPINSCEESQCPPNERYERCPPTLCTPQTCSQLGFPINCPDIPQDSSCPGEPACVCNVGYVRNDKGVCIPVTECPSCGGDENAEPGCGFACGKHCKDLYNDEPRACILSCILNGCQCKPGKYYDEITKKCVDPSDCTQVCPDNEVLSDCVNGGCDRRNCSQLDQPRVCIDPYTCEKGCICKEGYLRHAHGYCVPIDECPLPKCEKNEVVSYCVNGGCEKQYCSQLEEPDICIDPIDCIRGCICKDGYLRNDNDVCVPINECCKS